MFVSWLGACVAVTQCLIALCLCLIKLFDFFFQIFLLSLLTTQFMAVISLAISEKESSGNSGIVGSLFPRSSALKQAPLPEKESAVETASGSPRGQRCVKCGGGGGGSGYGNYYGNYQDR